MGAHTKQYCGSIVLLFLLISCFLWNCGDKKDALKAPIVSKKISTSKVMHQEKQNALETQKDVSVQTANSKGVVAEKAMPPKRIYDPKKRINPFIPLFKVEKQVTAVDNSGTSVSKKRRIPKTPLEKIGLDQLELVATIRAPSGNKGLVEDSSGKGFIIKTGTYIGLNSGIVTQISANHIVIEEEVENLMGKRVLQNTEIKLQKPAGE